MRKRLSCRFGFHRMVQTDQLITTGRCKCRDCGEEWITSLFGNFPVKSSDAQSHLPTSHSGGR